jgi:hypothetical protein
LYDSRSGKKKMKHWEFFHSFKLIEKYWRCMFELTSSTSDGADKIVVKKLRYGTTSSYSFTWPAWCLSFMYQPTNFHGDGRLK